MEHSSYLLPCTVCDAMLIIAGEEDRVNADNYFQFADLMQSFRHVESPEQGKDTVMLKTISIGDSIREWVINRCKIKEKNCPIIAIIEENDEDCLQGL